MKKEINNTQYSKSTKYKEHPLENEEIDENEFYYPIGITDLAQALEQWDSLEAKFDHHTCLEE